MAVSRRTSWAVAIFVIAGVAGWFAFASSKTMAADGDEKGHDTRDGRGHDDDAHGHHGKKPAGHPSPAKHGHHGMGSHHSRDAKCPHAGKKPAGHPSPAKHGHHGMGSHHSRDAKCPHAGKKPAGHPRPAKHGHHGKDGHGMVASPHERMNPLMLIMAHDLNNDGKVAKKELLQVIEHIFAQADTDKNDSIDKKEAAKLTEKLKRFHRHGSAGKDHGRPQHPPRPGGK